MSTGDPERAPLIRPFCAWRPAPGRAAEIAAPPYDVLSTDEARELTAGRPWSFLHVSRPEIDLPPGADPHADAAYAKAAENMQRMIDAGVLLRDPLPCYYAYRLTQGEHVQTGVAAAAAVSAYRQGRIRRHELTRPDKEIDRARHIAAVGAHTGPVFVFHRPNAEVAAILGEITRGEPASDVTAADGVRHQVWVIADAGLIAALGRAFEAIEALYVADGHHRAAAAVRLAEQRQAEGRRSADGDGPRFLIVSFPSDEVRILDYNRGISDLGGLSEEEFLAVVEQHFRIETAVEPVRPEGPERLGMFLGERWYRLTVREPAPPDAPPVERLDIRILSERLLAPVLGITDPRTDSRIHFIGGGRGLGELERRVRSGEWAVAFSLFPPSLAELMAVADSGQVMPPKSTWFEPKLADGLISLPLD